MNLSEQIDHVAEAMHRAAGQRMAEQHPFIAKFKPQPSWRELDEHTKGSFRAYAIAAIRATHESEPAPEFPLNSEWVTLGGQKLQPGAFYQATISRNTERQPVLVERVNWSEAQSSAPLRARLKEAHKEQGRLARELGETRLRADGRQYRDGLRPSFEELAGLLGMTEREGRNWLAVLRLAIARLRGYGPHPEDEVLAS